MLIFGVILSKAMVGQVVEGAQQLDRVLVRQGITSTSRLNIWRPLSTNVIEGLVAQLDRRGVTIQPVTTVADAQPPETQILSAQLIGIEPHWRGVGTGDLVKLFQRRKYAEFVRGLREHDLSQIPKWQQLLLLEMVVRAVDAVQGPASSGQHFIKLAESAPEYLYAEMPLCWTTKEPNAELIRKSKEWLDSPNEVAQLLGASWLLLGVEAGRARELTDKLRNSTNPAIAQLATAQFWRLTPPPNTKDSLAAWIALRDRMLPPLALGPTEFLADRLARIGEVDLAVGQWLWIATTLPDRHNRAEQALRSAQTLVQSAGHDEEANRLADWLNNFHGLSE